MARIKGKDIYLSDDDQIYFGDGNDAAMWFDNGELKVNHTVSGVTPVQDYHLATKKYIDDELATVSGGIVQDHGNLVGLGNDDHTQYILVNGNRGFTGTVSGVEPTIPGHLATKGYVDSNFSSAQENLLTTSGVLDEKIDSLSLLDLTDTPNTYTPGQYLRTTTSGFYYEDLYVQDIVYMSATYSGSYRNGSIAHPFNQAYEAAAHINSTYTDPTQSVAILMLPGIYVYPYKVTITNTALKAIIGVDSYSVIIRPTNVSLGDGFIEIYAPILTQGITVDATGIPEFATTSGSCAVKILEDSGAEVIIEDCIIRGFYNAYTCLSGSKSYFKGVDIYNTTIGIEVADGSLADFDMLYVDGARDKHVYIHGGAEAYFGESEFSSAYIEGLTGSGTAVYAEGADTYVELFAGTNIWSCNKNIMVKDGAEIKIDNCVLEDTNSTPGIEQLSGSFLTIVNSRAPLSSDEIYINDAANVYMNAFASSTRSTTIGNGVQSDQDIFSINVGQPENPVLRYNYNHNETFRSLNFVSPTEGDNAEFFITANNGDTALGVHPEGTSAYNNVAHLGLVSIQDGVRSGWMLRKEVGATPDFTITNRTTLVPALKINYDNYLALTSGVYVNRILDDGTFTANDPAALATQRSTKTYVDNYSYSTDETDALIADHPHTASGISYNRVNWDVSNVKEALDHNGSFIEQATGTGRLYPETVMSGTLTNNLTVFAGAGYINYAANSTYVTWETSVIDMTGYAEGQHFVYIDENSDIIISTTSPNTANYIVLGFVSYTGAYIGLITNYGLVIGNYYNRIIDFINNLGPFLTANEGLVQLYGTDPLDIFSGACSVQYGTMIIDQPQLSSDDVATYKYMNFYESIDDSWEANYYFFSSLGYHGRIITDRWNDTTASGSYTLNDNYTFTQYSSTVTAASTPTDLTVGDFIYLESGGATFMTPVTNVSGTVVTLRSIYPGPGGTGTTIANKALPLLPAGKWAKHSISRLLDGRLLFALSQGYYDTEEEAVAAGIPLTDQIMSRVVVRLASIVHEAGATEIASGLYDIRPLPFFEREGGSSGGSGATATSDHGNLIGLLDDDHTQYVLANGSRDFSGVVKYVSHPTFATDTQIVDKKYVDDGLSAVNNDHGGLTGLLDDDHTQYHNNTRGDARYYTQAQIDTLSGTLTTQFAADSTLAAVHADRTNSVAIDTAWGSVLMENVVFENDPTILQRDDTNTSRIIIGDDGVYTINYGALVLANTTTTSTYSRILKNGVTEIVGSTEEVRTYNGERHIISKLVTCDLVAGDYIELQLYRSAEGTVTALTAYINVVKNNAIKGDKGDQGDQGISGLVTISGSAYFDAYDASGGLSLTTDWVDVPFDTERKNSGNFVLATDTELEIPFTSTYSISAKVSMDSSGSADSKIRLVKDTGSGYVEVPGSLSFNYNSATTSSYCTCGFTLIDDLNEGDKLKVQAAISSGAVTLLTIPNASVFSVHIPGGVPGADGVDGADGTPGSGSTIIVRDEGTNTTNTPHSVLNFVGAGVTASDSGSGVVTVTIPGSAGISLKDESVAVTGTPHSTLNFTGQMVTVTDAGGGEATIEIPIPVFGSWYAWASDETETSTNSATPVQKLRLSVTGIPEGYYRIGWYYEWRRNSASNDYEARVQIDDTTTIMEQAEEATDVNSWHIDSGYYIAQLTAGNHNFDFDHYGESTGNTSYTRRARFEFWRVA